MTYTVPNTASHKPLIIWLAANCAMIAAMITIGAITRLTESGLSMVEWRAMIDMLPPLNDAAWLAEFDKYQQTPEFIHKNAHMDVEAFKTIYFWEWFHRLWGRLIGLVYAIPLVIFWVRGMIPAHLKPRFILFLFLGGLQGFIGWFMVKSGLVNEPRVSHYRLALHLFAALILFQLLWIQMLALMPRFVESVRLYRRDDFERLHVHGWIAFALVIITMLWGAFVAGLDAGQIYNTFPLMGGKLIPGEWLFQSPWWTNFLDNHATVQWLHRVLGIIAFITVFAFALRLRWINNIAARTASWVLLVAITVQFILGIVTLLTQVALHPAVAHQFGGLCVLTAMTTWLTFAHIKRN